MVSKLKGGKSIGVILLFVFMFFLIFMSNVMSLPETSHPDGEIGCSDISGCYGLASCNEKGTHVGCFIECEGGATIMCPSVW